MTFLKNVPQECHYCNWCEYAYGNKCNEAKPGNYCELFKPCLSDINIYLKKNHLLTNHKFCDYCGIDNCFERRKFPEDPCENFVLFNPIVNKELFEKEQKQLEHNF